MGFYWSYRSYSSLPFLCALAVTYWVVCILVVLGQWNSYVLETETTLNVTLYYVHLHCLYTCGNVHVCHVRYRTQGN